MVVCKDTAAATVPAVDTAATTRMLVQSLMDQVVVVVPRVVQVSSTEVVPAPTSVLGVDGCQVAVGVVGACDNTSLIYAC